MNINLNSFNMGNMDFSEIQRICAEHPACDNCPVYNNNGLHSNNSVTMCEKTIEKIAKEQHNDNS